MLPPNSFSVEEYIEQAELYQALYAALETLEERDQQILYLIFWDEQSEREAGKAIGLSQSAVNYRKKKALRILRELLKDFM